MTVKDELTKCDETESITMTLSLEDSLFNQATEYLHKAKQVTVSNVLNTLSTLYNFNPNKEIISKAFFDGAIRDIMGNITNIASCSKLISTDVAIQVCAEAYFWSMFDMLSLDSDIQSVHLTSKFKVEITISFNESADDIFRRFCILNYDTIEITDVK